MSKNDSTQTSSLLTVQEAADRLRCSRGLVYALCLQGKLEHHRLGLGRGTIRIQEAAIASFLSATIVEPLKSTSHYPLKHFKRDNKAGSRKP